MRKSRFTEEQIAYTLQQAEYGTPVAEITARWALQNRPLSIQRHDVE